jgi:single-strand DNA-binding protein
MTTEPNHHLTPPTNVVVVRGPVRGTPSSRELPSGSTVLQFDVTTVVDDPGVPTGRTTTVSVPIAWTDPSGASGIVEGTQVVVIGTVRRRFFRVGGATQSRTEVVAAVVIPVRRRKQVADALAALTRRLVG